jgi:AsmA-like C-terminal region
VIADFEVNVAGQASALAAIASLEPVNAMRNAPFEISDLSGNASAKINAKFPLKKDAAKSGTVWSAEIALDNVSVKKPFDGQTLSEANGTLSANPSSIKISADAKLNGLPSKLKLEQPLGGEGDGARKLSVQLELNEKARAKLAPGLNQYVKGPVYLDLQGGRGDARQITADLTKASIALDFAGWSKGPGVEAAASFSMSQEDGRTVLTDFELSGGSFILRGDASLDKSGLATADLSRVSLVRGDNVAAKITRTKGGYDVKLSGASLDVRAIVKKVTSSFDSAAKSIGSTGISVSANIEKVTGFNSETLSNLKMTYAGRGSRVDVLKISGVTNGGGAVALSNRVENGQRQVQIQSADAGSILRFFDYYDKMSGGSINISLGSEVDGPLRGSIDARDFTLINEPRIRSLVGGKPDDGGPSLKDAVKKDIDVSKVRFSRGSATIEKGEKSLSLTDGILRGDLIGLAFKGTAYDPAGNMNMTGTFMPAYGLNRIFGEIPLLGQLLGNGEERGLIGITFRLAGKAKSPQLSVNPISLIAPGIFRQIFEFR